MKIVRYRALRRSCRITITELARVLGVSWQRISQIEQHPFEYRPEDPERLILALENAVAQQINLCESALNKCRNMRDRMFENVDESEV